MANFTGEGEAQSLKQSRKLLRVKEVPVVGLSLRAKIGGRQKQRGTPMEIEVNLHPFRQSHKSYDHISRSYEERILRRTENEKKEITFEISTQAEASKLNSNFGLKMESSKSVFVGNLPHDALETDLYETFSVFGEVAKVEINRYMEKLEANFGFVEFYSEESVANALKSQQRSLIRLRTHESGDELFESELFVERKFNAQESDI